MHILYTHNCKKGSMHTSVLTEALGGGSHTAVMPAAFMAAALLESTLYHAGSFRCEHSQLKPCNVNQST